MLGWYTEFNEFDPEVNVWTPISRNGFPRERDIHRRVSRERKQLATSKCNAKLIERTFTSTTFTSNPQLENQFLREVTPFLKSAHIYVMFKGCSQRRGTKSREGTSFIGYHHIYLRVTENTERVITWQVLNMTNRSE